jgi:hypothetical protein
MTYNIQDTNKLINIIRSEVKQEYGQTVLDELNDEELINFALSFFLSNLDEEILR